MNVSVPLVIVKSFRLAFVSKHFLTTILSPINEKVGFDCFLVSGLKLEFFFFDKCRYKNVTSPNIIEDTIKVKNLLEMCYS